MTREEILQHTDTIRDSLYALDYNNVSKLALREKALVSLSAAMCELLRLARLEELVKLSRQG